MLGFVHFELQQYSLLSWRTRTQLMLQKLICENTKQDFTFCSSQQPNLNYVLYTLLYYTCIIILYFLCGILDFERSLLPSQSGQCPGK